MKLYKSLLCILSLTPKCVLNVSFFKNLYLVFPVSQSVSQSNVQC
jgi:hypothetical protein